jgi:phytoene dehydrogenase-like protein
MLAKRSGAVMTARCAAAFGLVLGILGHVVGWPFPCGGSQKIADALAAYFSSLGGELVTGLQVESLDELPSAHLYLCDLTPREFLRIAGKRLPSRYQHKLER